MLHRLTAAWLLFAAEVSLIEVLREQSVRRAFVLRFAVR
jgi:hypothetical protein